MAGSAVLATATDINPRPAPPLRPHGSLTGSYLPMPSFIQTIRIIPLDATPCHPYNTAQEAMTLCHWEDTT